MKNLFNKLVLMLMSFVLLPALAFAEETEANLVTIFEIEVIILAILLVVIFLVFLLWHDAADPSSGLKRFTSAFMQKLTGSTPIEKEESIILSHNYDGIRELDNKLPPWWLYLFYVTIVFGVVYMLHYHVLNTGPSSSEEYVQEVEFAQAQLAASAGMRVTEETVQFLTDAGALSSGKDIYTKNCAACHGQKGEGLVGPNLTDDYWIHGGGIKNVYKIIQNGVVEKGMLAWKSQLSPSQMQDVGSYVLSLKGTNPPNAKAPQGEKFVESDSVKTNPM